MNTWWLHPDNSTIGVSTDGTSIYIDRDGDGVTESSYAVPLINNEPLAATNLRLTPTREVLYAFGDSCPMIDGAMVYFFDVPAPPAELTLIDSECIEWGIGDVGFYDTMLCTFNGAGLDCPLGVSPNRIAYVADAGNIFAGRVKIYWFDLVNGTHTTTQPGFGSHLQLGRVPVSPYGDAAFVEHGVETTSDYTIIDLCALPRLGVPISPMTGGSLFDLPHPEAIAEMVDLGGGNYVIRVTHPDIVGRGSIDYPFVPEGGTPPDPDGACCMPDGTCTQETAGDCGLAGGAWLGPDTDCADCPPPTGACCFTTGCFPDMSESACQGLWGAWEGAGSTCDDCPPFLQLQITKSAPSSVPAGLEMTYTLNYENIGGQVAYQPQIVDPLPTGTTFVSATDGGYLDGAYARWQVDTLDIGASDSVSFTVLVDCGVTEITNTGYRISVGLSGTFYGTPVTTTVLPASADPVSVAVASTPSQNPLERGDPIEHAITITNSIAEDRNGITFVVDWGYDSDFDVMIDDAGGTVVYIGTSSMRWTGGLPASGDSVIRFRTRVKECATWPEERLNEGLTLDVRSTCGDLLGSADPPAAVPIQTPTTMDMHVPAAGAPQHWLEAAFQALRAGETADIQLTVSNVVDTPQAVSITHVIPFDLAPVGNPPFVAPTEAGAQYDEPSRTISWSGMVAAQSNALITYRATLPEGTCRVDAFSSGDTGTCTNDLSAYLTLLLVPEPRDDAHLLHLSPFQGISDAFPVRELFCLPPEIDFGMGRGPDGDVFVAGVPNFWFNAETLEFEILDDESDPVSFAESVLGIAPYALLHDVAVDPLDGTALFAGINQVEPPLLGAVGRYDPATGQATQLVAHEDLGGIQSIVCGADGMIATVGYLDGVVQIDPANPSQLQIMSDMAVPNPTCIAIDDAGDYVVANAGATKKLARVDRQTGVYTVLVDDLDALVPISGTFTSAAVDENGDVYLMSDSAGGMLVQLGDPPTGAPLLTLGETSDLEYVIVACPGPDFDDDGDVDWDDFGTFVNCLAGPDGGLAQDCECIDLDTDGDVDLVDFAEFQSAFTGS